LELAGGLGHLTYSTLVHPGDTWPEMRQSLGTYLPAVKARVCPDAPFGVSLRLSASSAETLHGDPSAREELAAFLAENDLYLYTVNAFPYGAFKGGPVKQEVYEPDWRSPERRAYTARVADILAEVGSPAVNPSIQTPPLGFKPNVTGPDVVDAYTENLLHLVAHLVGLERSTGRTVTLAIEPEPYCFLETTPETVGYFEEHLYTNASAARLARLAGLPLSEAHGALRRHLGVVFDICHQALEYEDVKESVTSLNAAGIPIFKFQEAAAIRVPEVTDEAVDALRPYAETIYLTQTLERSEGEASIYLNLEEAFAAWEAHPGPREWRVHIHVPVFLEDLGAFQSTRQAIVEGLSLHREAPLSAQLEIETYTWDMLPEELKTGDIVDYVSREIEWVRGLLEEPQE
jgi:hypothetical protein